jgi:hypothetical protein
VQNQQILAHLLTIEKKRRVEEVELLIRGYNFQFQTHTKRAKMESAIFFVMILVTFDSLAT